MRLAPLLLIGFLLTSYVCFAQIDLGGRVLSADNKVPVASANVYISNSSIGTVTDEKGQFVIKNLSLMKKMAGNDGVAFLWRILSVLLLSPGIVNC